MNNGNFYLAIISTNRVDNVSKMAKFLNGELKASWYVADDGDEAHGYRLAGADNVVRAGKLMQARNFALRDAMKEKLPCVQLSDDLKKLELATSKEKKDNKPLSISAAVDMILETMNDIGAHYGGVAPTANAFYFNPEKPVSTNSFIVGDFTVYHPEIPDSNGGLLRFDQEMTLKEDYDFTCQHLTTFGVVARRNDILATFLHRQNAGGAVDYRTANEESKNIKHLRNKWGDVIKPHPTRDNEVILKWGN